MEVGKQVGEEFEIPLESEEGEVFLGRDPFCKVRLYDPQLSRRHCRLTYDGTRVIIKDLGSKNGTKVNGRQISRKTQLRHGDHVNVGSSRLVVKYPESAQPRKGLSPLWHPKTQEEQLAERVGELEGEEFAGYEVEGKLWDGDMTVIYRARKPGQEEAAALKIMRPIPKPTVEQVNRFLRGARSASQLTHRRLVRMLEFGQHMGIAFAAMEFVPGTNLQLLLKEGDRPMKPLAALKMVGQICEALQYVYGQRFVLRSVRPENVLVLKGAEIKLTDYDLLKQLPNVPQEEREITRVIDREVFVEPSFAAPELIAYPLTVDQRADVFGAGACLYYMVTLVPPFPTSILDDRLVQAFDRVVEDPASHNPNMPDVVRDVILKAMSSDPRERYEAPWEMIDALQEAQEAIEAPEQEGGEQGGDESGADGPG